MFLVPLLYDICERFEPRSNFKSRLSLIVRVNVVRNRTVVVDSDWHLDNLCGSYLQSQSELYHVSWWYCTLVIDLIGQLRRHVIGRLSVKPWCYWLWRLVIASWCVSRNNSHIQDYVHPDDQTQPTCLRIDVFEMNSCLNIMLISWFLCVFYSMTFVLRNTDPTQRERICSFADIKKKKLKLTLNFALFC